MRNKFIGILFLLLSCQLCTVIIYMIRTGWKIKLLRRQYTNCKYSIGTVATPNSSLSYCVLTWDYSACKCSLSWSRQRVAISGSAVLWYENSRAQTVHSQHFCVCFSRLQRARYWKLKSLGLLIRLKSDGPINSSFTRKLCCIN